MDKERNSIFFYKKGEAKTPKLLEDIKIKEELNMKDD